MEKEIFAGVDIGSLTSKALLVGREGIISYSIMGTGANPQRSARQSLEEALRRGGVDEGAISSIVATGYGRIRVPFRAKEVTEITCHSLGAHFLFPKTRTVIDIGGQDSKVITLDENGRVSDFVMNDKCAAGTGRFLEVMAHALEVELSEMGRRSLKVRRGVPITSMCTVFAESEVISLIAEGHGVEEILRGLHESIAQRIFRMAKRLRVREEITLSGGVAKNEGIAEAIKKLFGMPVNIPEEPQIVGALGAALQARRITLRG